MDVGTPGAGSRRRHEIIAFPDFRGEGFIIGVRTILRRDEGRRVDQRRIRGRGGADSLWRDRRSFRQGSEIAGFGWVGEAGRRMNIFGFDLAVDGAEFAILIEVAEDKIVLADKVKGAAVAVKAEGCGGGLIGQIRTGNIGSGVFKIILEACPVFEVERVVGVGSEIRTDALIGTAVDVGTSADKIDGDVIGTLAFGALIGTVAAAKLFIVKRICGGHGRTPLDSVVDIAGAGAAEGEGGGNGGFDLGDGIIAGFFVRVREFIIGDMAVFKCEVLAFNKGSAGGFIELNGIIVVGNFEDEIAVFVEEADIFLCGRVEEITADVAGGIDNAVCEFHGDVIVLGVEVDDVQVFDGIREGQAGVEFKGDGTQAVIIEINTAGETNNGIDLGEVFRLELILHVGADLISGGIIEPEVVVEAAGAVDKKIIETLEIIAGDNEEALAVGGTVKQGEHGGLRVGFIIIGGMGEGFIKFIKEDHDFLVNGFEVGGDAGDGFIDNEDGQAGGDGAGGEHAGEHRLTDAFCTAEDDAERAREHFVGRHDLFNLGFMRAIDGFVDLQIGTGFQIEAAELGEADAIGGGRQRIEGAKGIIIDLVLDAGVDDFHKYVTP